jgi:HSP90 family molecular chaperone
VFSNLRQFEQRQLVTAEKGGLEVDGKEDADEKKEGEEGTDDEEEGDGKKEGEKGEKLSKEEGEKLCAWIRGIALPERVEECKTTTRLASSPAIVTGHESGALRRMMKMVDGAAENGGGSGDLGKQVLEINPKHPLIRALSVMSAEGGDKEELAKIMTEQVFNNAIISAGIVDDARTLVPNIDKLLMAMVDKK